MARIAGVDLPREKRVEIALTYIFGIGLTLSKEILAKTEINPDIRVKDLSEEQVSKVREILDKEYGKKGTKRRDEFEKGYEEFKLGILIQQARLEKGLTQEQLAEKCGTNKGYISKVENNIKDVRLSTLQKIVEIGLGGKLNLGINL